MRHFFLDTNVVIDFLADRKPFSDYAAALFQSLENGRATLYVASLSFNNVYYIIRQVHGHKKALQLITLLECLVEIAPVGPTTIKDAIASAFKDFEDAIQSFAAESVPEIDAIVTRNFKDFSKSKLPVISPEAALALLES